MALALGAAQVLRQVGGEEIFAETACQRLGQQQPPMLAPLTDGDECTLAGDEMT
jgi:hypothetical protein